MYRLYHIPQKKSSKSRKFFARLLKYFFASGKFGMQHEVENAAFSDDEDMDETEDVDMTM